MFLPWLVGLSVIRIVQKLMMNFHEVFGMGRRWENYILGIIFTWIQEFCCYIGALCVFSGTNHYWGVF